jgi:hypothetical protein
MGIILKTKFRLRAIATSSNSEVKKSNTPFMTKELFDSPGCTRAVIITPLRAATSYAVPYLSVIVKRSTLLFAIVLHKVDL